MPMKAVLCKAFGPPESLVVEDVPSPVPGPGEVVISVKAASVNFPDVLIIQNKYQFKPPLPFSPGSEVAGIVKAVGDGVTAFTPGDRGAGDHDLRRLRRRSEDRGAAAAADSRGHGLRHRRGVRVDLRDVGARALRPRRAAARRDAARARRRRRRRPGRDRDRQGARRAGDRVRLDRRQARRLPRRTAPTRRSTTRPTICASGSRR